MSFTELFRPSFRSIAVVAAVCVLVSGGRASAQQPSRPVYIPPDVKGLQAQRLLQQAAQQPAPTGPRVSQSYGTVTPSTTQTPPAVQLTLTFPSVPDTAFVAIRGPDGEVRYFPVAGGRNAVRAIVVRPGERVHIQLPPPKSP